LNDLGNLKITAKSLNIGDHCLVEALGDPLCSFGKELNISSEMYVNDKK